MSSKLSWRDAWLLPLISACTVLCLLIVAEIGARTFWPERKLNSCVVYNHTMFGHHYKPNCVSTMKSAEGPWFTNRYNECGYRSDTSCGPVSPGVRRIAVIGSSVSEGYLVDYPHTFAAQLREDLTAMCPASVDVQNLAETGYAGRLLPPLMDEALRLRPAAVVYFLSPYDVQLQLDRPDLQFPDAYTRALTAKASYTPTKVADAGASDRLRQRVSDLFRESRAATVAQHFLFQNPSFYLPMYLHFGDKADFLRPPFTPRWQERLRQADLQFAALSDEAHRAGVPLILVFVPHQAEIAIQAGQAHPLGVDPRAFPEALEASARRHGAIFIDSSEFLVKLPDPARFYYRIDGHLSGKGQTIIARFVAGRMAALDPGPFADCHAPIAGTAASRAP